MIWKLMILILSLNRGSKIGEVGEVGDLPTHLLTRPRAFFTELILEGKGMKNQCNVKPPTSPTSPISLTRTIGAMA